jgi:hypothetical protein
MRPGEAWALDIDANRSTKNWIDWEAGELHVKWQIDRFGKRRPPNGTSKGKGRTIYLLPPATAAMRRAIEDRPNGEVFYTIRGLPMTTARRATTGARSALLLGQAARRTPLEEVREAGWAEPGKIAVDFDLYELRHFLGRRSQRWA